MKKMCIVLIGPPCSGKSTIGRTTANNIGARYISSGDIARKMAENDNGVKTDLSNGKLAPENMMRDQIYRALYDAYDTADIVILDGFPRFGDQAKWLRETLPMRVDIRYVCIHASEEVVMIRSLERNRMDDKSISDRYEYYKNTTLHDLYTYINKIIPSVNTIEYCCNKLKNYIMEEYRC